VASGQKIDLVAIVGPTAAGKSSLAMRIAEAFNGEIISADSRTVYKEMDIGTAKPSKVDQRKVRHNLIDVVAITDFFSVSDFKTAAIAAIKDIQSRGKLPVLVGGSGLYVDAILLDFAFLPPPRAAERERLNNMSLEELHIELARKNITPPLNSLNKRHVIRALETGGRKPTSRQIEPSYLVIGLDPGDEQLSNNISQRTDEMIDRGLEDEVRYLYQKYGRGPKSLNAIGYFEWQDYINGTQDLETTKQLINKNTRAYIKRQRTWFKRNKFIHWFDNAEDAFTSVKKALNN
jgi:tRNA dimethylallyltransferase